MLPHKAKKQNNPIINALFITSNKYPKGMKRIQDCFLIFTQTKHQKTGIVAGIHFKMSQENYKSLRGREHFCVQNRGLCYVPS